MPTVYVVQELKRFHCPKCDGTYSDRVQDGFKCRTCQNVYPQGIQKPIEDLTATLVFGQPEILIKSNNIGIGLQPLVAQLRSQLRSFSDEDFLLVNGDPVAIGLASSIAAEANRGRVTFLKWDRYTRQYLKLTANIRGSKV